MPKRRTLFIVAAGALLAVPLVRRHDRRLEREGARIGSELGTFYGERYAAADKRERVMLVVAVASCVAAVAAVVVGFVT